MVVLVCGDRRWTDKETIRQRLKKLPVDTIIIHGNNGYEDEKGKVYKGADKLAAEEARKLGMTDIRAFPAQWDMYGKAAGPIGNRLMLEQNPTLVLAFHSDLSQSKGTFNLIDQARKKGGVRIEIIAEALP